MNLINDPQSIARYWEMDRLSREAARQQTPAEKDRSMQANRAMAMTAAQRYEAMNALSKFASKLKDYKRCADG